MVNPHGNIPQHARTSFKPQGDHELTVHHLLTITSWSSTMNYHHQIPLINHQLTLTHPGLLIVIPFLKRWGAQNFREPHQGTPSSQHQVVTFKDDSMRKMTLVDYLSIPPPRTLQLQSLGIRAVSSVAFAPDASKDGGWTMSWSEWSLDHWLLGIILSLMYIRSAFPNYPSTGVI